jgi:hypothetical protein
VFTTELKFIVNGDTARMLEEWARAMTLPDPHGIDPTGDGYRTSTLYFDTDRFHLYLRRGSHARAKFRIRRYNGGADVFLERKLRLNNKRVFKRRSTISLDDLAKLAGGSGDSPGAWFTRRLQHRRLRPVCQIDYRRTARLALPDNQPIRLTIDYDITASVLHTISFANDGAVEILPGRSIVELKYGAHLPSLFQEAIAQFHLTPHSLSKYRLAVRELNLCSELRE